MTRLQRAQLGTIGTRRLFEFVAGLGFLLAGLTIYRNHGFESSAVFLLGLLMTPLGVLVAGVSLVGKTD